MHNLDGSRAEDFDRRFQEISRSLHYVASRMTGNAEEAEDLVQDVRVKILCSHEQFKTGTDFKAWCFTIMKNHFVNICRKNARRGENIMARLDNVSMVSSQELEDPSDAIIEKLHNEIVWQTVRKSIACWSPTRKRVFLLYIRNGCTYNHIARQLGMSDVDCKTHLLAAKRAFQSEPIPFWSGGDLLINNFPDLMQPFLDSREQSLESLLLPDAPKSLPCVLPPLGISANVHEYDVCPEFSETIERSLIHGRAAAHALLPALRKAVQATPEGHALLVRLDRVRLSSEVAEEVVQHLFYKNAQQQRFLKGRHIVLVNPDEGTKLAVHRALEVANDSCAVLETEEQGIVEPGLWRFQYVGKLQPYLQQVLDFMLKNDCVTSTEVARDLNISLVNAGNRLRELFDYGFIKRHEPISNEKKRLAYQWSYFHPELEYSHSPIRPNLTYQVYSPPRITHVEE